VVVTPIKNEIAQKQHPLPIWYSLLDGRGKTPKDKERERERSLLHKIPHSIAKHNTRK
jgi:hypothetical protein